MASHQEPQGVTDCFGKLSCLEVDTFLVGRLAFLELLCVFSADYFSSIFL